MLNRNSTLQILYLLLLRKSKSLFFALRRVNESKKEKAHG
jgi:hypothetical protein